MKVTHIVMACALLGSAAAGDDVLHLTVSNLEVGNGNLRIAVFNESRGEQFPEGMHLYGVDLPAGQGTMTVDVAGVEPGRYAIAAYQDANQNQRLDRDADNIPVERYGFSVHAGRQESTFEQAVFDTEADGYDVSIILRPAAPD